ncbi:hypothetical protein Trydic_g13497 [Trypoxylus dichotomus]
MLDYDISHKIVRKDSIPLSLEYDVLITILNPNPRNLTVDLDGRVLKANLEPFLEVVDSFANFTVKSQWLYLTELGITPKAIGHNKYAIYEDQLPLIITPLEKKMWSHLSPRPSLNLVTYISKCDTLLYIYNKNDMQLQSNAFLNPRWGGISIINPDKESCIKGTYKPDVAKIISIYITQLKELIGLKGTSQQDTEDLAKVKSLDLITSTRRTLKSLALLLSEISTIVISEEVALKIKKALENVNKADDFLSRNDLGNALQSAKLAYHYSEGAFGDPSLLALLYFPDDQKYAIYVPLFLPIMIPVLMSLITVQKCMEKLQELEVTYDDHMLENDNQSKESESFSKDRDASLQDNQNNVQNTHISDDVETVQNVKTTQESNRNVMKDEIELSKNKVKDNLSEVCKKNTENMVKSEVKAGIAIKCLGTKLQAAKENRTSLETFLHECEFQQSYLQDQLHLEQIDRMELSREMATVDTIIDILKAKFRAYEDNLGKFQSEMIEYKEKHDQMLKNYLQYKEEFEKEFEMKKSMIEKYRNELAKKQLNMSETEEEFINKKIKLEGDILKSREELSKAKENNEVLLRKKAEAIEGLNNKEEDMKTLQEKLNSITAERIKASQQQQDNDKMKVVKKHLEIEFLKQRLTNQHEYLDELIKKSDSLESEKENLLKSNNEMKREVSENQNKYEEAVKSFEANKAAYKNELLMYVEKKKEMEREIEKMDANIMAVTNSNEESNKKLEALKETIDKANATISSLNGIKENLKAEIEEQKALNQEHTAQNESLNNTLADLQTEILQLDSDYAQEVQNFSVLQSTFAKEIKDLEEILDGLKAEEIALTKEEEEFGKLKVEDEKRKEDRDVELRGLEDKLKTLKEEEDFATATVKDLSGKLEQKTEKRDSLHNQYRKLQEEIDRLEERVKTVKNDASLIKPATPFQKLAGILKNSNVKSPTKKVTFNKSANWDTLSESSTEALFDSLLKKKSSSTVESKPSSSAISEMINFLRGNSPPVRETGK